MLLTLAKDIGFSHAAWMDMNSLVVREDVRQLCAADRCGSYGKSWSCPPYIGALSQLQTRLKDYSKGVLVQTTGTLADDFDMEGMGEILHRHHDCFRTLTRQARLLYPKVLPLAAGACNLCRRCTCPDRPCRFPKKRLSSMEAYGLMVSDVCEAAHLPYSYGSQTMTFISCVLIAE